MTATKKEQEMRENESIALYRCAACGAEEIVWWMKGSPRVTVECGECGGPAVLVREGLDPEEYEAQE
jgi:transcription elongation factor Elf1